MEFVTKAMHAPGSAAELAAFAALQEQFVEQFRDVFPDRKRWQTVVVVPSASIDMDVAEQIHGIRHYEERMLYMLMLLRQPRTRVVFVTSQAIDPAIIDYYLHLLAGIPSRHAKQRLVLLSCHDSSAAPLSEKILERRLLINRICNAIQDPTTAHLACYNVTTLERTLAVRLGIPLYGCDPSLSWLGTKSGGRQLLREAGVATAPGDEDLCHEADIVSALVKLKREIPDMKRAVLKLNEGISGQGNAVFSFAGAPVGESLPQWVVQELPQRVIPESDQGGWPHFRKKFKEMGGVVECFLEAKEVRSPSVQGVITPLGEVQIVSTHDQVLGGPTGQIYLGCTFPADEAYRLDIQAAGLKVGQVMANHGGQGRFAVDFLVLKKAEGWDLYAIEINVRKGGTTHPFLMLQFLTDGVYQPETGLFCTPTGQTRYYYASDNLQHPNYRGLTPEDLINIVVEHTLHFHTAEQRGVVFHLIGALSEYGKLGALCVEDSPEKAKALFDKAMEILNQEAAYCMLDV